MKKIVGFVLLVFLIWAGFFVWNNLKSETPLKKGSTIKSPLENQFLSAPQVSIVATNLNVPWTIAFLPDKSMLVTERAGNVRFIDKYGNLAPSPVATIDDVKPIGEGGLLGIVLHPKFSENQFVYLYYTYFGSASNTLNRVVRFKFDGTSLGDEKIIVDKIPGGVFHDGGRIKFGPDGYLYVTTGDATNPSLSQNKNSLAGKILRVTDEGKIPRDNPFGSSVYSFGHRNPQGITWDGKGNLWETEHGPTGEKGQCCHDELNLIESGANYGWPDIIGSQTKNGLNSPIVNSENDTWAPSGTAYLNGSIFFSGLKGMALYEYKIADKKLIEHFKGEFGRIREVIVGPDGFLYITTSNRDGRGAPEADDDRILKINPQKL